MMNNKGFMMAEVVVVASIILVAMVGLYASYNKVFTIYNQRVNYYDVSTLYELGNYRDENGDTITGASSLSLLFEDDIAKEKIYFVLCSEISQLKETVANQTFKDYIKFLSTSLDIEELESNGIDSILVMEKCIDSDNCKYAYLEVFDET